MAEQVEVRLTVDADGAIKTVEAAGSRFEALSESAADASESMDRVGDAATDAGQTVERGAESATQATRTLAQATDRAADAQRDMSRASGNATQILFSAGDAVQDVQFGFAGAANNIAFMAEQFADVQRQAGGTANALKLVGRSLWGAGGVIFGFQILLAAAPQIISFFSDTEEGAEDTASALDKMAEAALEIEGVGDLEFEPVSPERAREILRILDAQRGVLKDFALGPLERYVELSKIIEQQKSHFTLLDRKAREQLAAAAMRERDEMEAILGIQIESVEQAQRLVREQRERLAVINAVEGALQKQTGSLEQQRPLERLLARFGIKRKEAAHEAADGAERQVQAMQQMAEMRVAPALSLSEQLEEARRRFQQLQDELAAGTEATGLSDLIAEATPEVLSRTEREIRALAQALGEASKEQKGLNAEQQQYADLVAGALSQGFIEFGRAIGEGQAMMEALGSAAASIIGSVARAIGQQLVAMGTAMIATAIVPGLQANAAAGAGLIAAGGTLLAASGALSAIGGGGSGGTSASRGGGGQSREGGVTGPSRNLGTYTSAAQTTGQPQAVTVSNDNSAIVTAITEQTRRLEQVERTVRVSEAYDRIVDYDAQQGARGRGTRLNHG